MTLLARFIREIETPGIKGTESHVPGLLYRFARRDGQGGHVRLFGRKLLVHWWGRTAPDWALTRTWLLFGLATLIHVERGEHLKRTSRSGWHVRFASVRIERFYNGIGVSFRKADRGWTA